MFAMEIGNTENMTAPGKSFSYWKLLDHSAYQVILEQNFLVLMYHAQRHSVSHYIQQYICYVLNKKNIFFNNGLLHSDFFFSLPKPSSLPMEGR